jgi:hypothetical protein
MNTLLLITLVVLLSCGVICLGRIVLMWGHLSPNDRGGCRHRMVVGFTTTYTISAYHH